MAYKMKGHTLPGIKQKKSPVKQKSDMPKDFNIKGSKTSTTPRYNPNMPKDFNVKGSSSSTTPKYTNISNITKGNIVSGGKQVAKKVGKFLGGKALGVGGMMMATSSKADQPKFKKGDVHYKDPKKKIDFTKKK